MPKPALHLESAKEHLAEHGETRAKELADAIGVAPGTLQAALTCAIRDGYVIKRKDGRATYFSLPGGEPQPLVEADDEPQQFLAQLDTDGDLDLYGVIELEDGGVRIPADGVRKLCRLLHGQGPEE